MITILVHRDGATRAGRDASTRRGSRRRRRRSSGSTSTTPGDAERRLLTETSSTSTSWRSKTRSPKSHHPKIETLRRLPVPDPARHRGRQEAPGASRRTTSTSSSAGTSSSPCTMHRRGRSRRSARCCAGTAHVLGEGPRAACCTASSIGWSTTTARRSTRSRTGSTRSSSTVFSAAEAQSAARHPGAEGATSRRCGASTLPQRDAVSRLARREFPQISEALAYRFRDVYDHLVRLTDEALFLQDRVTGLLDAHLVDAVEPAESGHEGADGHRDDLHAAHGADRACSA